MTGSSLPSGVFPDDDVVLDSHHVSLEPVPRSAGAARRFLRENSPALPDETADSLLLLTSELVTNAVLHARTAIELGVVVAEHSLVVTVRDLDLVSPLQDPYAPAREGGWGLELVSALADSWDVVVHPQGGKTAWFRLLRGEAHAVPDGAAARTDAAGRDS